MWFFKKTVIKKVRNQVRKHLVSAHKMDLDTISKELRCVEQDGVIDGKGPVTFLRVFRPAEAQQKEIVVTGWETFDQHPDLILFKGHLTITNEVYLEQRKTL